MFHFQNTQIGKKRGFRQILDKILLHHDSLREIEKHITIYEQRNTIRLHIELPVSMTITLSDGKSDSFACKSTNFSETGVLINFWVQSEYWKLLELRLEKADVNYRFIKPEEIAGIEIEGSIRHHMKKISKRNQLVELEMGIENRNVRPEDHRKIKHYIDKQILVSLEDDIRIIEDKKTTHELSESDLKIYDFLLKEHARIGKGLE
ncbi:hypothetical protein ACFL6I_15935 [candidate division KSB1 bacterium]